jgi:hypothetical protein
MPVGQHPGMRGVRLVLACAALVFASSSAAAEKTIDRGIVVRVAPPRFVIRELDGSRIRFRVNRTTVVTLDGRPVGLRRLRRGDVAAVDHVGRVVIAVRALRP